MLCLPRAGAFAAEAPATAARPGGKHAAVPVIGVTDLYHPPQDADDNFDLLLVYGLPEMDLRAVVLYCTDDGFRRPISDVPGMTMDRDGPREPGILPVAQLNYIFGRAVPCAPGPFTPLKHPADGAWEAPGF